MAERVLVVLAPGILERREPTHKAADTDWGRWKNHLLPYFGHYRPHEITPAHVRAFAESKLRKGLKSGTITVLVSLLSAIFSDLMEDGQAQVNPCRSLTKATRRLIKSDYDTKTTPFLERLEDVQRVFLALPEPLNIGFAIGALAGLRTSEVFGLQWRHVDLKARRIHVRQQVSRKKGEVFTTLKDKDSRVIPLIDALAPILEAWKFKNGGQPDSVIVPSLRCDGATVNKKTPGPALAAVLEDLGLNRPGLGWYECTRHTFASSQWVLSGGSLEKLKEILGHYSVVMTERYAHLKPELFTPKDLATIPRVLKGPSTVEISTIGHTLDIGWSKGGSK